MVSLVRPMSQNMQFFLGLPLGFMHIHITHTYTYIHKTFWAKETSTCSFKKVFQNINLPENLNEISLFSKFFLTERIINVKCVLVKGLQTTKRIRLKM